MQIGARISISRRISEKISSFEVQYVFSRWRYSMYVSVSVSVCALCSYHTFKTEHKRRSAFKEAIKPDPTPSKHSLSWEEVNDFSYDNILVVF